MTTPTPGMPDPLRASLLAAALNAASRGWYVFPLIPNDKRPAVRDWQTRATRDQTRIRRCWSAGAYGVGIACGPSRLVVLDLDTPKDDNDTPPDAWRLPGVTCGADVLAVLAERYAEPLPLDTYTVRTGRGGTHLYFRTPNGAQMRNTAGRLGWKIDTRATGGYVVGAGSIAGGRPYRLDRDVPTPTLPAWLSRELCPPRAAAGEHQAASLPARTRGYVAAAFRGEIERVLTSGNGERNHTLFRAASALGRFVSSGDLPRHVVETALQAAAEQVGPEPHKIADTIRRGIDTAATQRPGATA